MELNSSINTFIGGMSLDTDKSLLKENQYTYAEDIRLLANEEATTGILQNRDCLKKFEQSILMDGETILGTVVTRVYNSDVKKSEECIVVITYYNNINNIYIIYIEDNIKVSTLLSGNLGYASELKIVANYESDTVSKIYIVDGIHRIKVIDICKEYSDNINEDSFDILPTSNMPRLSLRKMIKGQLQVGAVQYAYQLFSKHGSESTISQVSPIINIPKIHSTRSTKDVYGGEYQNTSNIGCQISIRLQDVTEFDSIRLYRIRYDKNNSLAEVFIMNEFQIPDKNEIIYNDTQDTYLSTIPVDVFNAMLLTEFVPKTIEKHDNRLFAANIKEDTWDVEYDARAYRCDSNGNILLKHSNSNENIEGTLDELGRINGKDVPKDHDCINPSNEILFGEDANRYIYYMKDGVPVIGGKGPNISYEFCFTDVVCSDQKPMTAINLDGSTQTTPSVSLELESSHVHTKKINIYDIDGNAYPHYVDHTDGVMTNYADSYFTANFLGYQRDEIYRFGIVFYNNKNQKTPVHWIGDIRIPCQTTVRDLNSPIFPFHFNAEIDKSDAISGIANKKNIELLGKAIGIKFTINKDAFDDSITKWEIVRCPRTEIDRTIVTQGVLNSLIHFDTWGSDDKNLADSDIRPTAILNFGKQYNVIRYVESRYKFEVLNDYVELISPEIAVSRESILDNLKNQKVCFLNWLFSRFPASYESEYDAPDYLSDDSFVAIRQQKVYTNVSDKSPADTGAQSGGLYSASDDDDMFIHFGVQQGSLDGGEYGNALLFKAYKPLLSDPVYTPYWNTQHSIKNAIIGTIHPRIGNIDDAKAYAQPIGDKNYVNTSVAAKDSINNHGISAILHMDTSNGFVVGTNDELNDRWYGNTPVVNIKQQVYPYGGYSYTNRTKSTYIPCTQHTTYDDTSAYVFGGDTYLGVFDYTHTTVRQYETDPNTSSIHQLYVNCYIPLESTINLNLFSSDTYSKTVEGAIAQNLIQYDPFVSPVYTQTKPLYEYNSAYSVDGNAQIFVPELLYSDPDSTYETRITCSELKTNNEIIDSWTKFKFANYLDVDNQYGPVTNLKSFNGKLFFWQDSSIGVASVNERSLIQDNNISQLTLGTGGILVRYDYYTTSNGSKKANDRSICNSTSTLYWFDSAKHEICAINNTVIELSKVKGVKSWCNKQFEDISAWYDYKYNEICMSNGSEAIVFNEQLNVFTSFYKYPADYVANFVDKLVTIDNNGYVYLHGVVENYEPFKPHLQYTINKGYPETKVFDNVWFDAEFSTDEILESIVFKTKTQETNIIDYTYIENREDTYRLSIPRDKYGVARMRGKYLICDYTFDCIKDGDFKIPYIKTTFRISRV